MKADSVSVLQLIFFKVINIYTILIEVTTIIYHDHISISEPNEREYNKHIPSWSPHWSHDQNHHHAYSNHKVHTVKLLSITTSNF